MNQKTPNSLDALNEMILPVLFRQLENKGLMPIEIKRLTRDILNIIGHGGLYNAGILNQKLEHLGWEKTYWIIMLLS